MPATGATGFRVVVVLKAVARFQAIADTTDAKRPTTKQIGDVLFQLGRIGSLAVKNQIVDGVDDPVPLAWRRAQLFTDSGP